MVKDKSSQKIRIDYIIDSTVFRLDVYFNGLDFLIDLTLVISFNDFFACILDEDVFRNGVITA